MNKKSLFFFILFFSFLKGEIAPLQERMKSMTISQNINVNQNSIKSYSDYLQFKKSIEKMAVFQPSQAFFILGSLYMKEFKFKSKVVKSDFNKALYYFKKSFNAGNPLAAYYIALIENKKGNTYEALVVLQRALDSLSPKNKIYPLLSIEYGSIVLDSLKNDKDALKKAINYIQNVDANNYTAAYLLANLLYFLGPKYTKQASELLNYACSNTKDKGLLEQCKTNPYIKGNKITINCPIAAKQER